VSKAPDDTHGLAGLVSADLEAGSLHRRLLGNNRYLPKAMLPAMTRRPAQGGTLKRGRCRLSRTLRRSTQSR